MKLPGLSLFAVLLLVGCQIEDRKLTTLADDKSDAAVVDDAGASGVVVDDAGANGAVDDAGAQGTGDDDAGAGDAGGAPCPAHKHVRFEEGLCVIEAPAQDPIVDELLLSAGPIYKLAGVVVVGEDAPFERSGRRGILRIEAGTEIRGGSGDTLLISRGSQIYAEGAENAPVVFTSNNPRGKRAGGDWIGVAIAGRAPTHDGFNNIVLGRGFGGDNITAPNDHSGTLDYVNIEFAGEDNPAGLPALTLAGLGADTGIAHVQVHKSFAEGVGIWGGTVNMQWLAVTGADLGASIHIAKGYQGQMQNVLVQQHESMEDPGVAAIHVDDSRRPGGAVGGNKDPRTAPQIANATLVGSISTSGVGVTFEGGAYGALFNTYIVNFEAACVDVAAESERGLLAVDDPAVKQDEKLLFDNVYLDCWQPPDTRTTPIPFRRGEPALSVLTEGFGPGPNFQFVLMSDQQLTRPFHETNPNFEPRAPNVLLGVALPSGVEFLAPENQVGAFSNYNWLEGWGAFPQN